MKAPIIVVLAAPEIWNLIKNQEVNINLCLEGQMPHILIAAWAMLTVSNQVSIKVVPLMLLITRIIQISTNLKLLAQIPRKETIVLTFPIFTRDRKNIEVDLYVYKW